MGCERYFFLVGMLVLLAGAASAAALQTVTLSDGFEVVFDETYNYSVTVTLEHTSGVGRNYSLAAVTLFGDVHPFFSPSTLYLGPGVGIVNTTTLWLSAAVGWYDVFVNASEVGNESANWMVSSTHLLHVVALYLNVSLNQTSAIVEENVSVVITLNVSHNSSTARNYSVNVDNLGFLPAVEPSADNLYLAPFASGFVTFTLNASAAGTYNFTVTVANDTLVNTTQVFTLTVTEPSPEVVRLNASLNVSAVSVTIGQNASFTLSITHNSTSSRSYNYSLNDTSLSFDCSGSFLTLAPGGSNSTVCTVSSAVNGTFPFVVNVTYMSNGSLWNVTGPFTLNVTTPAPLVVVNVSFNQSSAAADIGENVSVTVFVSHDSGEARNYTLTLVGASINYSFSPSENVSLGPGGSGNATLTINSSVAGLHQFSVTASDTVNASINGTSDTFDFTVTDPSADNTPPVIHSAALSDNYTKNNTQVTVTVNVTDNVEIRNVTAGAVNLTPMGGDLYVGNYTLNDSESSILILATDTSNNTANTTLFFTVDIVAPVINWTGPDNNGTLNQSYLTFTWTTSETATCQILVNGSLNVTASTGTSFSRPVFFNASATGLYNVTIVCNDSVNNTANESRMYDINDTMAPASISVDAVATHSKITFTVTVDEPSVVTLFFDDDSGLDMADEVDNESAVYEDLVVSFVLSSLEENTRYYYKFQACDVFGACVNTSEDHEDTEEEDDTPSSSGGDDDDDSSVSFPSYPSGDDYVDSDPYQTKVYVSLRAGQNVTFAVDKAGLPFSAVSFVPSTDTGKVTLGVYYRSSVSSRMQEAIEEDLYERVYAFVEVQHRGIDDEDVDDAAISFSVPKTWLERQGVATSAVKLKFYVDDEWQEELITAREDDGDEYRFTASADGLGYFAITGIGIMPRSAGNTGTPVYEGDVALAPQNATNATVENVTGAVDDDLEDGGNRQLAVLLIIIALTLLASVGIAFYMYHRKVKPLTHGEEHLYQEHYPDDGRRRKSP